MADPRDDVAWLDAQVGSLAAELDARDLTVAALRVEVRRLKRERENDILRARLGGEIDMLHRVADLGERLYAKAAARDTMKRFAVILRQDAETLLANQRAISRTPPPPTKRKTKRSEP